MKKLLLLTIITLIAQLGFSQSFAIIGSANISTPTLAANQTRPTPYNRYWESRRVQMVYTASELSGAGMTANSQISALSWDVSALMGAAGLTNYTIRMAHTSATNCATYNSTALTTVRNAATLGAGNTGWYNIPFDANFTWNGTSNILVDVCWGVNSGFTNNGRLVFYNSTTANEMFGVYSSTTSQCGVTTGAAASGKPRIRFTYIPPGPLTYSSSTTTQNTTNVVPNSTNQQIIGIPIVCTGTVGTLNLTQLDLNIAGSTSAADITNAKVYYTGTNPTFSATGQFGSTITSPTGAFTVTGTQALTGGTNYFWLTYDVPSTATLGNVLDATCTSITVGGTAYTPTVTAPAGNRPLALTYCNFTYTGLATSCGCFLWLCNDYGLTDLDFNNVDLYDNATCSDVGYIDRYNATPAVTVNAGQTNVPISTTKFGSGYQSYMYVYVDWNNNGTFTDSGELIFASPYTTALTSTGTFNVPSGATAGAHRMRVVSAYANPAPCSADQATAYDFKINVAAATPMAYVSNTVNQITGNVAPGTADQPVLNIKVNTTGSVSPINLNSITANTTGSTNPATDITEARVFYTGNASTFGYGNIISQVGTAIVNPNGTLTFTGNTQLVSGENNFWLVYSVAPGATNANLLDAQVTDIVVDNTSRTPSPSSPTGNLVIAVPPPFCTSGLYTVGCNDGVGPLDGFTNVGLNGLNNPSTCGSGGYTDFTGNTPYTLYKGQSNLFTVTNPDAASEPYSMAMYIDQNGNGVFEDSELYLYLSPASAWTGGTLVGNFTLPNILQPGLRRMRIRCAYNTPVVSGYQCNVYQYGEIEDYMVNILENPGVAQVGCGYTATVDPVAYSGYTDGTLVASSSVYGVIGIDDVVYPNQPIGFNFDYNGTIYNSLGISDNGYIWFGTGTPSTINYLPIGSASPNLNGSGTIDGIVAAFGADLLSHPYFTTAPNIRIKTTGSAPNRQCTIQWTNFYHADAYVNTFCPTDDDHRLDFQIILSESTGSIRIVYGNQNLYCIDVAQIGQVGLRGANAADFNVRKLTSGGWPDAASTAGTTFLDQFILASDRYFRNNTSYLFTPALVTPVITANGPTAFCDGANVNLSTTTIATGYQWFESNLIETGQTANNYTVTDGGSYHIRVASGSCFRQSDPIAVTVYDLPDLVTTPTSICEPATIDLGTTFTDNNNTVGNVAYYATLANANANTNPIDGSTINASGTYYIKKTTVAGSCTDVASVAITIYDAPKLVITNPTTVCAPTTVNITTPAVITDLNNLPGTLSYYPTEQDAIDGTNPLANATAISTSGTYWIKKVSTTGGCVDIKPVVVTINPSCGPISWVGGTSGNETNWNTANNWSTGVVPTAADDITIPDQPYDPQLFTGANGVAKTITIAANVTVTINSGYTLDVKGNWIGTPTTTVGGPGKIIFSGNTAQSISGGGNYNTLQINNTGGGVTVAAGANKVRINTALELKSGQLTTNGNIQTISTALNTAYIDDFSPTFTGTLSGNVAVERYITNGPNGYRYIGAPVATTAGGTTLNLSALSGFVISGTPGQLIPLPTCNPNNSASNSPYGTFMRWEEAGPFTFNCRQAGWFFQTTGTMTVGRGYGAKIGNGSKITYTGAANTGVINYGPLANSGPIGNGWHLVSNPYPSNMAISNIDGNANNNMPAGFNGQIQLYITSGPYTGSYLAYNTGLVTAPFALGQGFWVQSTGSGTFSLNNNYRVTNQVNYYDVNSAIQHHLKVDVAGNGYMDKTDIYFLPPAQTGVDFYDAEKWAGRSEQPTLYTTVGSQMTAINSLPSLQETVVVPMGLKPGTSGNFTFTFDDIASFPQTAMIYLEDLQLGTMNNLRENNTYAFSMNATDNPDRFMLHFQPGLQAEVADQDCDNAGSIELTQPAPTVWSAYEVRGNDNNVYAQGTNFTGSLTIANLPAQEYVVTVTHPSGYSAQEFITVNGSSPVNATINASATNVMIDEMVSLTATATNATEYVWNFGDGNTQSGSSSVVHAYDAAGTYNVTVTASGNLCEDVVTKTIVVGNTTGIDNTQANTINIYGQGEHVVVEFNNWGGNKADIFMYNALGQRMESLTGVSTLKGRQELNITNIIPGTYFIQVVSDGKIQGKKVFLGKQ